MLMLMKTRQNVACSKSLHPIYIQYRIIFKHKLQIRYGVKALRQTECWKSRFLTKFGDAYLLKVLPCNIGDELNIFITVLHQHLVVLA